MSDPSGTLVGMGQMRVTATDFRVHLKDFANQVAEGGDVLIVQRHGFAMGVFIGCAEYEEFCRWRESRAPVRERPVIPVQTLRTHPDNMPIEEVQRLYEATKGMTDESAMLFRGRAFISLKVRTGQYPDPPC
jgi:hypothetical protein